MTPSQHVMPDYVATLEMELRAHAREAEQASTTTGHRGFGILAARRRLAAARRGTILGVILIVGLGTTGTALAISNLDSAEPALSDARPAPVPGDRLPGFLQSVHGATLGSLTSIAAIRTDLGTVQVAEGKGSSGARQLCFQERTGGGGCAAAPRGLTKPVGGVTFIGDGQYEVTAVLPATVRAIAVVDHDGRRHAMRVERGVATRRLAGSEIASLSWVNADGSTGTRDLKGVANGD